MAQSLWMSIILLSFRATVVAVTSPTPVATDSTDLTDVIVEMRRNCLNLCDTIMSTFQPSCSLRSTCFDGNGESTYLLCAKCMAMYPSIDPIVGCCMMTKDYCLQMCLNGLYQYQTPCIPAQEGCSRMYRTEQFLMCRDIVQSNNLDKFMNCMTSGSGTSPYPSLSRSSSGSTYQPEQRQVVGIAVGVSVGGATLILIIVFIVVLIVVLRRRRRPVHAKDFNHIATAPAITTNVYQTAPSAPTLYQDINDVSTTTIKQTTSDYEEPEPVAAQQRNEVQPIPDKTPPTHDPAATYGDTTLIDNTLYNMDNNSTTCLTTTSRDQTYSDTTLIDNSLYRM